MWYCSPLHRLNANVLLSIVNDDSWLNCKTQWHTHTHTHTHTWLRRCWDVSCRRRQTLLSAAYNDVRVTCGQSAAVTFVKMTGYIFTLSQQNDTRDNCTGCKSTRMLLLCTVCNSFGQRLLLIKIIVKKLDSLKRFVRTTVAASHN